MESYRDIYKRFIENYRTETGGINVYPQFDYDLDTLLYWLENDDAMGDWTPEGEYIPDTITDCSWKQKGDRCECMERTSVCSAKL